MRIIYAHVRNICAAPACRTPFSMGIVVKALAAASALMIAACAGPAWAPPAGHPADPAQQEGTRAPLTALERYRGAVEASAPAAPPADEPESPDREQHRHHGNYEETTP